MKRLALFLCLSSCISLRGDNFVIYAGTHGKKTSEMLASALNLSSQGIALSIPMLYINRCAYIIAAVSIGLVLYKCLKSKPECKNRSCKCVCCFCQEDISNDLVS